LSDDCVEGMKRASLSDARTRLSVQQSTNLCTIVLRDLMRPQVENTLH